VGLLPGDILLAADGQALTTPTALAERLDGAMGGGLVLRVLRGGSVREVTVTPRAPG
jgi:S1-C subfamily serine protease